MFLWARDLFGPGQDWAALVAATAYMYAPYLLTNVFVRGAIAEVGTQALLPWILWSTWRLMKAEQPANYVLPVVLSLGGLAVTHSVSLLFVPPFWLAYVLALWWTGGRRATRLIWAGIGGLGALAVSAFFWVPLIVERQYLSEVAYKLSATFLPEHVWTWRSFIDHTFLAEYSGAIPFRLGLVQVVLAISGLVLARRRDPVWLLLVVVALLGCLGITYWTLPLWLHNRILLIAQFPWRLLTLVSVPLALFAGGILIRWHAGVSRVVFAVLILVLIIVVDRPRVDWMALLPAAGESSVLPAVAQVEGTLGAFGTSSAQEFLPRWVQDRTFVPSSDLAPGQTDVHIVRANSFDLTATVSDAAGGPLRFANFYFPGWRVVLDGKQTLRTYPSTNLGLLTVDLPPGAHIFQLSWAGTRVQYWATAVTLLALAGLTLFCALRKQRRWLAVLPLVLLVSGLTAASIHPALLSIQAPSAPVSSDNVSLAGFRTELEGSTRPVGVSLLVRAYYTTGDLSCAVATAE